MIGAVIALTLVVASAYILYKFHQNTNWWQFLNSLDMSPGKLHERDVE